MLLSKHPTIRYIRHPCRAGRYPHLHSHSHTHTHTHNMHMHTPHSCAQGDQPQPWMSLRGKLCLVGHSVEISQIQGYLAAPACFWELDNQAGSFPSMARVSGETAISQATCGQDWVGNNSVLWCLAWRVEGPLPRGLLCKGKWGVGHWVTQLWIPCIWLKAFDLHELSRGAPFPGLCNTSLLLSVSKNKSLLC